MQLQHFLSCNKANIKHSCKSQLYNTYNSISLYIKLDVALGLCV